MLFFIKKFLNKVGFPSKDYKNYQNNSYEIKYNLVIFLFKIILIYIIFKK